MSELHDLCRLQQRPIGGDVVEVLEGYLRAGVPATYTLEEAANYEAGVEAEPESTTTPLHIVAESVPEDASEEEAEVVSAVIDKLFEYGAGWCLVNAQNETPGCVLVRRGMRGTRWFEQMVEAGVRAELLLRKVGEVEWVDEDEVGEMEEAEAEAEVEVEAEVETETKAETEAETVAAAETTSHTTPEEDTAGDQSAYLASSLTYTASRLTTHNDDGVMMDWETPLMRMGADTLASARTDPAEPLVVVNLGFGMGIIDTFLQSHRPTTHYICEAHPDVLAKMRADGWYDKPGVVVLEGRWQQTLSRLLDVGVVVDGIYYDTFSETYDNMLELFDYAVGLLLSTGVLSFFNGLGGDRLISNEVYRRVVEIDLGNYGLAVEWEEVPVDTGSWADIKKAYYVLPTYHHPTVRWME